MYNDLRDQNKVFQGMLAADRTVSRRQLAQPGGERRRRSCDRQLLSVAGLKPAVGRLLTPARRYGPRTPTRWVVLRLTTIGEPVSSHARDVVGQTVLINGHPFTILGVAPEHFDSAIARLQAGRLRARQHGGDRHAVDGARDDAEQPPVNLADAGGAAQARRERRAGRGQPGTAVVHSLRAYELTLLQVQDRAIQEELPRPHEPQGSRRFARILSRRVELKTPADHSG